MRWVHADGTKFANLSIIIERNLTSHQDNRAMKLHCVGTGKSEDNLIEIKNINLEQQQSVTVNLKVL
jgi:hypothetical protein